MYYYYNHRSHYVNLVMLLKYSLFLLFATITACSSIEPEPVGSDRDEYGCLPSAGYLWCERSQTCERSWETTDATKIEDPEVKVQADCEVSDSKLISAT